MQQMDISKQRVIKDSSRSSSPKPLVQHSYVQKPTTYQEMLLVTMETALFGLTQQSHS